VIRNAVIHISNEQPLLADLFELPKPGDQGLVCTNVRMLDGTKPIFVDQSESVFYFPYLHIRFVELRPGTTGIPEIDARASGATPPPAEPEPAADADEEIDEEFLRRIRDA
jgi:hypothetical protein